MTLPEDLKRFRADTANERAMEILEIVIGIVGGLVGVGAAMLLILSLA